jgi:outer membrane biosynthesis protein TonB
LPARDSLRRLDGGVRNSCADGSRCICVALRSTESGNDRGDNMTRLLDKIFVVSLLAGLVVQPAWSSPAFVAPGINSAGNIAYPSNVATPGIVTLMAKLDNSGNVQNLDVLRDLPSLSSVASAAVKSWGFTPASLDGQAVPSVLPISVVFNPFNPGGVGYSSQTISISPATPGAAAEYMPPQITAASYATYPAMSVSSGAVVLDVVVGSSGKVAKVHVVRGVQSLTPQATKAVKAWTFSAATFQGTPIGSHMVIAFVFPSPGTGSF